MFAKLFDHTKFGQVAVIMQQDDDGNPEIRFFFKPPELGVSSLAISFSDDPAGWSKADTAFAKVDAAVAEALISSGLPKELITSFPIVNQGRLADVNQYIVELEAGVWLSGWDGDPGRTLNKISALKFDDRGAADKALHVARQFRLFPNAKVLPADAAAQQSA